MWDQTRKDIKREKIGPNSREVVFGIVALISGLMSAAAAEVAAEVEMGGCHRVHRDLKRMQYLWGRTFQMALH